MELVTRAIGPLQTNVCLVGDPRTREAIVVDGAIPCLPWVADEVGRRGWRLILIVSTHGHWDHAGENAALPSIIRAPTPASVPAMATSANQSITVAPSGPSVSAILAVASTAVPDAWPCTTTVASSGSWTSENSAFTTNFVVMKPTPTLPCAWKRPSSSFSIDSTPGPQLAIWSGSVRNAQTFARGAWISTWPSNFMRQLLGTGGQASAKKRAGFFASRVRQPAQQKTLVGPS